MSSLRGRTRDSSWQWLVIGLFLGLGCSGVFCLGLYATGTVTLTLPGSPAVAAGPTVVTVVVTTTPPPVTPTAPPTTAAAIQPTASAGTPVEPSKTSVNLNLNPSPTNNPNVTPPTPAGTDIPKPTEPPSLAPTGASGTSATIAPIPGGATLSPTIDKTELIEIPGNTFSMGTTTKETTQAITDCTSRDKGQCTDAMAEDSNRSNNVTLNTYELEKYEVSFAQYIQFLNFVGPNSHLNGCGGLQCVAVNTQIQGSYIKFDGVKYDITNPIYLTRPVSFVTWYGADSYCKAIGRRLPSEAEWEHAARGTANSIYPWGDTWDPAKANTSRSNPSGPGPVDVSSYSNGVSQFGVFNMAGNVAEWVNDWYDPLWYKNDKNFVNVIGPKGPPSGSTKVVRGGSYADVPFFARTVQRTDHAPNKPEAYIGFRCAADKEFGQPSSGGGTSDNPPPPTAAVPAGGGTPTATKDVLAPGSG